MWIMMNDGFLSIVRKGGKPGELCVRARRAHDIRAVFPDAKVTTSNVTDYRFRAFINESVVAKTIAAKVLGIGYDNFKNSTKDEELHGAYARVWGVMYGLQREPQRRERKRRQAPLFAPPPDHEIDFSFSDYDDEPGGYR